VQHPQIAADKVELREGLKFPSVLLQTNLIVDVRVTDQLTSEVYLDSYIIQAVKKCLRSRWKYSPSQFYKTPLAPWRKIWPQPDSPSPCFAVVVLQYLTGVFPNNWTGRKIKVSGQPSLQTSYPSSLSMGTPECYRLYLQTKKYS
jgi:hypothetical protein